jgi:hypothetical protein
MVEKTESRVCTKQNLKRSRSSLTGWSEQQNIREDKTIGRLLHRCLHVHLLVHTLFENDRTGDHRKQSGEAVAAYNDATARSHNYKCIYCGGARAGKTRKQAISEDYYFCAKVKELGFRIMADTILAIHENSFCYVGQEPSLQTWLVSAADVR